MNYANLPALAAGPGANLALAASATIIPLHFRAPPRVQFPTTGSSPDFSERIQSGGDIDAHFEVLRGRVFELQW